MPAIEYHPLEPFLPANAKLLMLGSFPPQRKRWCMEFYYPNRTNMMWEVFGQIFYNDSNYLVDAEHKTFRLDAIKKLLNEKGIALYDTATAIRRLQDNASDKYLEIVEKTNLHALLQNIPLCHDIVCTGQKSAQIICEDYNVKLPAIGDSAQFNINGKSMCLHRMPSTSRAYPLPIEKKATYYQQMMKKIGIL